MLNFNGSSRFDSPGEIPQGVSNAFSDLIGRIAAQGDRQSILEHFKSYSLAFNVRIAKNYRSKSVWTLFQRKLLNNQTVWPVIFGFTGPICARALKSFHLLELRPRGHHDWPVKPTIHELGLIPDHKSGENIKIREDAISRAFVGRS